MGRERRLIAALEVLVDHYRGDSVPAVPEELSETARASQEEVDEVLVTVAGAPGPNARRRPGRFLRDLAFSRALADQAYEDDGSVWIDEWHTHPKGPDALSRYDGRTYRQLFDYAELDFEHFVSIVVTAGRADWSALHLSFWVFEKGRAGPARLDTGPPHVPTQQEGLSDERRS